MGKVYLVMLLCAGFLKLSPAQTVKWSKLEGSFAYDYGYGIVTDRSANIYVAGKFEESAVFSGTTLKCRGNHDMYLAKYDSLGNLKWIKTAGGPLGDYAHGMSTDGKFIYMCGEMESAGNDSIEFDGYPRKFVGRGENDAFVAKFDLNGKVLWVQQMSGGWDDKAYGISSDLAGNVYVSGHFEGTAYFGPNSTPVSSSGPDDRDIFIAKFNPDGKFEWVRTGGSPYRDMVYGMVTDSIGNSYITGAIYDNANFDGTVLNTYNNSGYWDGYLLKYDKNGNLVWAKNIGGEYDDVGWSLTMDKAGKIYLAGEFNSKAHFGSSFSLNSNGNSDGFVACYNSSGSVNWVSRAGGSETDRIRGIGTDGVNVFVTGQFGSSMKLGSKTLSSVDNSDIFAAKVKPDGNFDWSIAFGGMADTLDELGFESGIAITTDNKGNAYFTGAMLDGGSLGGTILKRYGRTDVFITRLANAATPYYIPNQDTSHHTNRIENPDGFAGLKVYPNPASNKISIFLNDEKHALARLILRDILGKEISIQEFIDQASIDVSGFSTGMYFLQVTSGEKIITLKVIVE